MQALKKSATHGLIYLDACLLIYAIENHPVWADKVTEALANKASENFAISPLIKMECLIKPFKTGDMGL